MAKILISLFCLVANVAWACSDEGLAYPHCQDQNEIFQRALDSARQENKMLVVVYGYQRCVWSRSLAKLVKDYANDPSLKEKFGFVTIAALRPDEADPKKLVASQSGLGVEAKLKLMGQITVKTESFPEIYIVDPVGRRVVRRTTCDLEKNDTEAQIYGHDSALVQAALLKGRAELLSAR